MNRNIQIINEILDTKFHIKVITKNSSECRIDLDEAELIARFIVPYEKGELITINGVVISIDSIKRVRISKSKNSIEKLVYAKIKYKNLTREEAISKAINELIDVTNEYLVNAPGSLIQKKKNLLKRILKNKMSTDIFIVHGQDEEIKQKVARFITNLNLHPIILHEQASSGKTIIEKIEEYSNVDFGVILYSPCDVGAKREEAKNLSPRARQNVVFEHGYLIGKLGRNKVTALVKNDVEIPNDISGLVYINFDNANSWKLDLAKEMKKAGYDIDLNKFL